MDKQLSDCALKFIPFRSIMVTSTYQCKRYKTLHFMFNVP